MWHVKIVFSIYKEAWTNSDPTFTTLMWSYKEMCYCTIVIVLGCQPDRILCQTLIAEMSHTGYMTWRNQLGSNHKSSSVLDSFHYARWCYSSGLGRKTNSLTLVGTL